MSTVYTVRTTDATFPQEEVEYGPLAAVASGASGYAPGLRVASVVEQIVVTRTSEQLLVQQDGVQ